MRRILVLRGGALGDFIVTLPALALLRQRWPVARIELVGNATAAQLGRTRALLDAVHSQHEARWSALFGDAPLPPQLAEWLDAFDLVVNYWPDPQGELKRRFPMHAGQTYLSAPAMPARAPAAAHYCEVLRKLGLETESFFVRLDPVALRVSAGTVPPLTQRAAICVHPGSGSPRKNWPAENWRKLIALLPVPISLILGEAESEIWSRGALAASYGDNAAGKPRPHKILLNAPLEELAAHLARCRLFLGHDSGISHLAAGCGAPCVLLFGPTDPAMWAPPAPDVHVLRHGAALDSISVDDVRSAVMAALADQR